MPGKEHCEPDERNESVTVGFSTGDDGHPEPYLYALAYPWPAAWTPRRCPSATGTRGL